MFNASAPLLHPIYTRFHRRSKHRFFAAQSKSSKFTPSNIPLAAAEMSAPYFLSPIILRNHLYESDHACPAVLAILFVIPRATSASTRPLQHGSSFPLMYKHRAAGPCDIDITHAVTLALSVTPGCVFPGNIKCPQRTRTRL